MTTNAVTVSTPAVLRLPGEAPRVHMGASSSAFLLTGRESGGRVGVFELALDPGAPGAALHEHHRLAETFYVLEGVVALRLEERLVHAPAGALMFVPPRTAHAFANPFAAPARVLLVFTEPGEREQFFEGLAHYASGADRPSPEAAAAFYAQFDQYAVSDGSGL